MVPDVLSAVMEDSDVGSASDVPQSPSQSPSSDNNNNNYRQQQSPTSIRGQETWEQVNDARPVLPKASFFLGDVRDGIPMLNMQSSYLISSLSFTEKQVGTLFFVFGISQMLTMAPAGYFFDYTRNKIKWVIYAGAATSVLTVLTVALARPNGENLTWMIVMRMLQGGLSSILTPGFNSITLGIVGSTGFTHQVSRNKMMNHIGTAIVVGIGALIAYFLHPNDGMLFGVSPLACIGMIHYLLKIKPEHVDRDAARGLVIQSPTMTEYETLDEEWEQLHGGYSQEQPHSLETSPPGQSEISEKYLPPTLPYIQTEKFNNETLERGARALVSARSTNTMTDTSLQPSFNFLANEDLEKKNRRARTPLMVLRNPTFVIFTLVVFFFNLANSSVLPLVMQTLSVEDRQTNALLSSLCIIIGQSFMTFFAKICGDYSPIWGRKRLFVTGLFALPLRCFLLFCLEVAKDSAENPAEVQFINFLILSTQILDSVGAGIVMTLYILVTNDISGGTGRFSLLLGITTAAFGLGGTLSGYIGQALAQDFGYHYAFMVLGFMSLIPACIYLLFMPETLPDYAKPQPKKRRLLKIFRDLKAKASCSVPTDSPPRIEMVSLEQLEENSRRKTDFVQQTGEW
eukprot:CAMPEP_0198296886 /NCGR_PEP_ID=MMETSP1449-20131203/34359_1 /TAXON_ID=420275 /ORGANISM="Attheya septentrionalis, Strain CCMP2084" /LENGTH=627 /DNA_ID=CAMNT_0043997623 /DNA_START=204 /DNA_END=2084 /DNA_ORIENTATION=+